MITKEFVEEFSEKYEHNTEKLNKLSDELFYDMSQAEWITKLKERSVSLRDIYAENKELLEDFNNALSNEISYDEALLLYDMSISIFHTRYDDIAFVVSLIDKLIPVFEEKEDYGRVVNLYFVKGNELAIFYRSMNDIPGRDDVIEAYRKVLSYKDKYTTFEVEHSRISILYGFLNYMMFMCNYEKGTIKDAYNVIKDMVSFFERPEIVKKNEDIQDFKAEFEEVLREMCDELITFATLEKKQLEEYKDILDELYNKMLIPFKGRLSSRAVRAIEVMYEHRDKNTFAREYSEEILDMLSKLKKMGFDTPETIGMFMEFSNNLSFFLGSMLKMDYTEKEKKLYLEEIFRRLPVYIESIPYSYFTTIVNSAYIEWLSLILEFVEEEDAQRKIIKKLLIIRQPITYIHSLMVSRIAEEITKSIMDENPMLFKGIMDLNTESEILHKQDEIVDFIKEAALLHDAGKCYITDIINRQNRALLDKEFELIKYHPELGYGIVNIAKGLQKYGDIIIGHHKFYDGKKGYPQKFDNTASKWRFLIDIISIADSIDAATDILGRNYAEGKEFKVLLSELKAEAGTRYNPDIVNLIDMDESLKTDLSYITAEGRYDVYREAYKTIRGN